MQLMNRQPVEKLRRYARRSMQTDWLIDFMTLAQTRSFSRAAQLRHVTQPALSRRIRSLEAWAMTALVDRSTQPPRLTPAGELLYAETPAIVASVQRTQASMQTHTVCNRGVLAFGCTHALALSFFPDWLCRHSQSLGATRTSLTALELREAIQQLHDGDCDLLLTYGLGPGSEMLHTSRFDKVRLSGDRLIPISRPDTNGRAIHVFPGTARRPSAYLGHSSRSEFGSLVERAVLHTKSGSHLRSVFEADSTQSLKAMALAGRGLAFLPEHSVRTELANNRLVTAGAALQIPLDIHLMRKPMVSRMPGHKVVNAFWASLGANPEKYRLREPA
jgi:DNA-binding transcriptional LysR family regulator